MAESTPSALNWSLLRRLRTALPFRTEYFVLEPTAKFFETMAVRADTQPEFVFLQLAATIATLSNKIIICKGPNLPPTWGNVYIMFVVQPKAGKTNAHICGEKLRRLLYAVTGMNNDIPAGTTAGVYAATVSCAKHGGQPLHAPDEGITSIVSLLEKLAPSAQTNFKPEVFFSSGWSGANVGRAKASGVTQGTEEARVTLLAMGTLADIATFHDVCSKQYANRGLIGRFLTAYAPAYSKRCSLPDPSNVEEESLLALNSADLMGLLLNALINVYHQVEAVDFIGFLYEDDALQYLSQLRDMEAAEQEEQEAEPHWRDALARPLLSHIQREFRSTEMIEKWALLLHVIKVIVNSINFVERQIGDQPINRLVTLGTVQRAESLVRRAQEQDGFFVEVLRIASTKGRDTIYVVENVDFVLYKCLRKIIMLWPGAVVTSESFADRCARLNVPIPYEEFCAAAQALASSGSLTKELGGSRITCPGIFKSKQIPRQEFRFYKTHPDVLCATVLMELGLELKEYTQRYHMDYYRVVDAQALRARRSEKKFDQWLDEIPRTLMPLEGADADQGEFSGGQGSSTTRQHHTRGDFGNYPKYAKFQHEDPTLRFGLALKPVKRRRQAPASEQQHLYRLPGHALISNEPPPKVAEPVEKPATEPI